MLLLFVVFAASAFATSNYEYKPGEYVTITDGLSPDGRYAIATHGDGDLGYDNWHVYLMNAQTGKKIGPLEEITDPLGHGCGCIRCAVVAGFKHGRDYLSSR